MVQWLRFCLPRQGARVPSLAVGAKIPQCLGAKKPKHEKKQYHNKFNKDFKNGAHTHTHTHTHTQKTSINLEKEARIKWEGMSPVKSGDHKGQGLGA